MKITYDKEADATYFYFTETIKKGAVSYTKKIKEWLLADYSENGDLLGIEILNASTNNGTLDIFEGKIKYVENNHPIIQTELHQQIAA